MRSRVLGTGATAIERGFVCFAWIVQQQSNKTSEAHTALAAGLLLFCAQKALGRGEE